MAVTYFPFVTAGPITQMKDILKQFQAAPADSAGLAVGLLRFSVGLFKKAVLSDSVAIVVDAGFGQASQLSLVEAWLSAALYLVQLYLDFSGYSDMAVGAARMLGHKIPENFNHPMTATSITEFWQRWHISLTNFITAYLYTPVIRSFHKVTTRKAMAATVAVMVIAGAWHGSSLPFVIFGFLHGVALAAHLAWRGAKRKMSNGMGRALTFAFVVFAFLFFRSPDLATALQMLSASLNGHNHTASLWSIDRLVPALTSNWRITTLICLIAPPLCFFFRPVSEYANQCQWSFSLALGVAGLLITSLLFLNSIPDKGFIYAGF